MTKELNRPLDLLNSSRNKNVMLELTSGKTYSGNLISFDIHINVVLENAREIIDGESSSNIGSVFFRGDAIILVTPSNI